MSEMSMNKGKTACFSGYRPHKFDFPMSGGEYDNLTTRLFDEIDKAITAGYDTFIIGCAPGLDIIAGEMVIHAKRAYSHIKLICALPFDNFRDSEHFDEHWRERYDSVMELSNATINVTDKPDWSSVCYDKRNRFMVDNSSLLICYSTGKKGGSESTRKYAISKSLAIVNVAT